jgi:hypothetical protein
MLSGEGNTGWPDADAEPDADADLTPARSTNMFMPTAFI